MSASEVPPAAGAVSAGPVALTPQQEAALRVALFCQAFATIGECLIDMSTILQQGLREDNAAKRGGIAIGLERAAAQVRGVRVDSAQ